MSGTALARRDNDGDPLELGRALYASNLFGDLKSAEQAVVKILAGREFGIGAVAAMSAIHIVKGKPVLGANAMAALVKGSAKYDYRVVKREADGCVLDFFERRGDKLEPSGSMSFSAEDAKRAGLSGDNWRKYPRDMMFARALTAGVRTFCPDLLSGAPAYTPEELGDDTAYEDVGGVEVVTGTVEPPSPAEARSEPQDAADSPSPEGAAEPVEAGSQGEEPSSPPPLDPDTLAEVRQAFVAWAQRQGVKPEDAFDKQFAWALVQAGVEGDVNTEAQMKHAVQHLTAEQASALISELGKGGQ